MAVDGARALLLVAAGAALGGVLRHLAGLWLSRGDYPWGTLAVNVAGSFLIGLVLFLGAGEGAAAPGLRLFVATGVLGGFTTMSSFSYETIGFLASNQYARAAGYAAATFVGSLGAAIAGRWVAGVLTGG